MKCPKCGYLSYDPADRCRVCGYDFSLALPRDAELPLQDPAAAEAPYADFDLGTIVAPAAQAPSGGLDLGRLVGAAPPNRRHTPALDDDAPGVRLPLFEADAGRDGLAGIAAPGPPRPPLAVRRATPEIPRARPHTTRPRRDQSWLTFEAAGGTAATRAPGGPGLRAGTEATAGRRRANASARLAAAVADLLLLGATNVAVVYLTLRMAGLALAEIEALPLLPLAAFLSLLNGGYIVLFTAAAGQTIGKMAAGVRVVTDDGTRLTLGRATLRAVATIASVAPLGLGLWPALPGQSGITLHDRVAGTCVVAE